ncbi:hypothetical protein [Metabacillus niabensis]|uniref:CN hydrolase domain-containing protein n=1 Tax=Metabacillus niabensis TaxID=324854 RepID=A0ABT9Z161_9BACI|nr:hypothetical protein [Metabacillus niabensis]MDQ0225972.1 hypothetical protein [Metabacillus niabensis]PAD66184.1 hypothetical protein CHH83_25340 [Bacillus sp. 7586-K]
MKCLIIQPKLENGIDQLEAVVKKNPTVDIVIFPEGYLNENVELACKLAANYNIVLIGGYRRLNEQPKDRVIVINRKGQVTLDRIKYSKTTFVNEEGLKIGQILCDELIVQGMNSQEASDIDLIVHPIGVGMFSIEQFEEWVTEATNIAMTYHTMVIGTSHADGSFGNTGVSIPIAYCIDRDGSAIFISKNDVRARILDYESKEVVFANN